MDLILCIPNHNFYENISKGCYAPQMRQGLDKYPHRNGHVIKHKKDDFRVTELRFPNFRIRDFEPQEYSIGESEQNESINVEIFGASTGENGCVKDY
ncbi:hypothetical protein ACTNEF_15930 [Bariatricus sp. HCP28S3_E4]|uniref:hypothetical protein n=1 Tax=unclassified Bariatricus TaxID=2677046 RepID=UPI003F8C7232